MINKPIKNGYDSSVQAYSGAVVSNSNLPLKLIILLLLMIIAVLLFSGNKKEKETIVISQGEESSVPNRSSENQPASSSSSEQVITQDSVSDDSLTESPLPKEVSLLDYWVYDHRCGGLSQFSNRKDVYGGNLQEGYHYSGSNSYWIEGEGFKTLKFKIAVSSYSRGSSENGTVTIYQDGDILFKQTDIISSFHTQEFEVELSSGAKDLKVEIDTTYHSYEVMLVEPTLYRG